MFKMRQEFLKVKSSEDTLEARVKVLESELDSLLTILSKLCKEIESKSNEHAQD
jgi:chaperonin cofactor prefoldin